MGVGGADKLTEQSRLSKGCQLCYLVCIGHADPKSNTGAIALQEAQP